MSLPVVNIPVNYGTEKGPLTCISTDLLLYALTDRIRDFFSHFVGPASGDVTDGMADMDIGDEDDSPETQRMKGLKYMSQLVRVSYMLLCRVCLNSSTATHREP